MNKIIAWVLHKFVVKIDKDKDGKVTKYELVDALSPVIDLLLEKLNKKIMV